MATKKELITVKENYLSKQNKAKRLFMSAMKNIKENHPIVHNLNSTKISRSFSIALTSLLSAYWILPELLGTYRDGYDDEISAIFIFISAMLFSSMSSNIPALCRKLKKIISESNWNLITSTGGGISLGVGIASLTPAAALSLIDGGILLGLTTMGLIGGSIYNKLHKVSYCDRCNTKGACHQKICRCCKHIYHPKKNIKNGDSFTLSGYEIVSYLSHQDLSYFDAKILVEENIGEWRVHIKNNGVPLVDKESFFLWVDKNKENILSYSGMSDSHFDSGFFEEYFDKNYL